MKGFVKYDFKKKNTITIGLCSSARSLNRIRTENYSIHRATCSFFPERYSVCKLMEALRPSKQTNMQIKKKSDCTVL